MAELILILSVSSWRCSNQRRLVRLDIFVPGILLLLDFFVPLNGSLDLTGTEGVLACRRGSWFGCIKLWLIAQWADIWVVWMHNGRRSYLILIFFFLLLDVFYLFTHFYKILTFCTMRYTNCCRHFEKWLSKLWWTCILQTFHRLQI